MTDGGDGPGSLVRGAFRCALLIYPPPFRRLYGPSMIEDFERRWRHEAERGGRRAANRFAASAIAGVFPSALRTWFGASGAAALEVVGAARGLRRAPGFTALSVGIFALGVAGSVLIFSVLYGVVLRPLPYADADRIMVVWTLNEQQGIRDGSSYLNLQDWAERSRTVEQWAWYYRPEFTHRTIVLGDEPRLIPVGAVSASFFPLLGIEPAIGRTFTAAEERASATTLVLSHGLWVDAFGADPGVVGRTLDLDGEAREVIGVAPPELELPLAGTRAWELHSVRTGWPAEPGGRRADAFVALARLAPTATEESFRSELQGIARSLQGEFPDENRGLGVTLQPLLAELTGDEVPRTLWLLQAAALLVLLAVAANVGQLWFLRALGRRQELSVRLALGAGRARIAGRLLAEGGLLTAAAVGLGLVVAWLALDPLLSFAPDGLPRLGEVRIDPTVAAATVLVGLLVGGLVALATAWIGAHSPSLGAVAGSVRSSGGRSRAGIRGALVIAQMALATVLLAGAGLFLRSVHALHEVDTGMNPDGLLVARVDLSPSRYGDFEAVLGFHDAVLERLLSHPAVSEASTISDFLFRRFPDARLTPEGWQGEDTTSIRPIMADFVRPGFIGAAGMVLLRGESFRPTDRWVRGAPARVVVNQALAEAFWPGQDAVGRRFQWGAYREDKNWNQVIGVVADARRGPLHQPPIPQVFLLGPDWSLSYMVRGAGDALSLVGPVREAVRAQDPAVPLSWVAPARDLVDEGLTLWRLRTLLAGGASGLVALLATVGLFGLLHEGVQRRRHEIGVRLALGALPASLRNRILIQGVVLAVAGLTIGLAAVVGASGALGAFLFGVAALDPVVVAGLAGVIVVLAVVASWLPARGATRVDPVRCLGAD